MEVKARTKLAWTVLTAWWIATTFGQNCRAKFDINQVCYENYGTELLQQLALSVVACIQMCTMDELCRSCTYDPNSKVCRTAQFTKSNFPTGCTEQVFYGEVVQAACRDTMIGDACVDNSDCLTPNSECAVYKKCRCRNSYSYKRHPEGCHGNCPSPGYGYTWKEEDHYLVGWNNEITSQPSLDACRNRCLYNVGFLCRSVEYTYSNWKCHLSYETGYSKPGAYTPEWSPDDVEFLRNCY